MDKIAVNAGFVFILMFWMGVYTASAGKQRMLRNTLIKEKKSRYITDVLEKIKSIYEAVKTKNENARIDKEVYEAISFLRNIIAIEKGRQAGTDFIIEELSQKEGVLQITYMKMLGLLRVNRKKEAQELLAERLKTDIGKEFAGLLLRWDEIDPKELSEILLSHQKSIKEIQMTLQKKHDETVSDILYFPIIVNVMLIFINFIYVGYFISQKEMLQMMF